MTSYDPYDPWMTPFGVNVRTSFYKGELSGKIQAVAIALSDWLIPMILRKAINAKPRNYPITVAQQILAQDQIDDPGVLLDELLKTAVPDRQQYGTAWGLGFPWMSKNGMYDESIPFITHTPYAMEALLKLGKFEACQITARENFLATWKFLKSLHILFENNDQLALSYAPIAEPRIVINANSYACYAFCLHGSENKQHSSEAWATARQIARYVVNQQNKDGSWYYYADNDPGNFIDCFHSCFVIKNLMKASLLDDQIMELTRDSILKGKQYIDEHFLSPKQHLVRRFTKRDIKDPYVWDLYDQAEYLGLLIAFKEFPAAQKLCNQVHASFTDGKDWYCKIDIFGRRCGKGFSRWGIVPFLYHEAELSKMMASGS